MNDTLSDKDDPVEFSLSNNVRYKIYYHEKDKKISDDKK